MDLRFISKITKWQWLWLRCSDDSCYPSRFATYRLCACADSQFFCLFFYKRYIFLL